MQLQRKFVDMMANATEVLDPLVVPTHGPVVLLRMAATAVTHGLLIPECTVYSR
jgi:hypothetical protein